MHRVGRDHRERRLVGALFAQVPGNRKMTANAMEGTPGICHLGLDCADGRAHRFSLSLEFLYSDNLSLLVAVKKKSGPSPFVNYTTRSLSPSGGGRIVVGIGYARKRGREPPLELGHFHFR